MNSDQRLADGELISAYLDGELSSADQERAETLLKDNDEMRQRYDDMRALRESLQSLESHGLGADFHLRVLERVRDVKADVDAAAAASPQIPARRWNLRTVIWPLAAMAATILIFLAIPAWQAWNPELAHQGGTVGNQPRPTENIPESSADLEMDAEEPSAVDEFVFDAMGDSPTDALGTERFKSEHRVSPKDGGATALDADVGLQFVVPDDESAAPAPVAPKKTASDPEWGYRRRAGVIPEPAKRSTLPKLAEEPTTETLAERDQAAEGLNRADAAPQSTEIELTEVANQLANTDLVVELYLKQDAPDETALDTALLSNNIDFEAARPAETTDTPSGLASDPAESQTWAQKGLNDDELRGGMGGMGDGFRRPVEPPAEPQWVLVEATPQDILAAIAELRSNQSVELAYRQLDKTGPDAANEDFTKLDAAGQSYPDGWTRQLTRGINAADVNRLLNDLDRQSDSNVNGRSADADGETLAPEQAGRIANELREREPEGARSRERSDASRSVADPRQSSTRAEDVAQSVAPPKSAVAGNGQLGKRFNARSQRGRAVRLPLKRFANPFDFGATLQQRSFENLPTTQALGVQTDDKTAAAGTVQSANGQTTAAESPVEPSAGLATRPQSQAGFFYFGQQQRPLNQVRVLFVVQSASEPAIAAPASEAAAEVDGTSVPE